MVVYAILSIHHSGLSHPYGISMISTGLSLQEILPTSVIFWSFATRPLNHCGSVSPSPGGLVRPGTPVAARKFPCTDQNKSFRGDGGTGEGEPFPKGIPSPGRPTFPNNRTGPSSLPPPPLLLPLAFRAQIGQRCGQQKEMA